MGHTGVDADQVPDRGAVPDEWRRIADAVADPERFVSATFSGARRQMSVPAERVTARPVDLRDGRHVQLTHHRHDGRSADSENVPLDEAAAAVLALLRAGYAHATVRTLDADLQLRHSRRGSPHVVTHAPSAERIDADHDRAKSRRLDPAAPFLHEVGITDRSGRVRPSAHAKYRQVERFLEILDHARAAAGLDDGRAVRAVDLGCGAGVLTLAAHHHLRAVAPGSTTHGVDTRADLIERLTATVDRLGWDGITFTAAEIATAPVDPPPDLVLALHACDTATDDALARAVGWQARLVLAAPCCQHDLQRQLDARRTPDDLDVLTRHGIVRERLGDLLTDGLRAEILAGHGYRTDIVEFVATEHTAKNLMIRAVRTDPAGDPHAARAARRLAERWGVEPALARRIGPGPGA